MEKSHIGVLNEKSLHAAIKEWLLQPGDQPEYRLDGYSIDIYRNGCLLEIQTRNFSAIKPKVQTLLENYPLRIIYPIAAEKWLIKTSENGTEISRRRSPRRGRVEDLFNELVRFPYFARHENFSLEVLLIKSEEDRINDGKGSWRRAGWSIGDRRLVSVLGHYTFEQPGDYLKLLPATLPPAFTTTDLSRAAALPKRTASRMIYCLTNMQLLTKLGRSGRSYLYMRTGSD